MSLQLNFLQRLVLFIMIQLWFLPSNVEAQVDSQLWLPSFQQYIQSKPTPVDYAEYRITHAHQSSLSNLYHVYLLQQYNGIDIIEGNASIHVNSKAELIRFYDQFINDLPSKIQTNQPIIPVENFILLIWKTMGYENIGSWQLVGKEDGIEQKTRIDVEGELISNTEASLKYVLDASSKLVLCWEILFETLDGSAAWKVYAHAGNGSIIKSYNQVISCAFEHQESSEKTPAFFPAKVEVVNPLYQYLVYPLKKESPSHGARVLLSNPADTTASPYFWHDTNGESGHEYTTTKGNNVEAREDKDGNESTLGQMAEGGENLIFDFPINPDAHPHINQNASITNLFYWNNIIHDIVYHYGFDEASGNFQENNYGNGGLAGDYVRAQAMDGGGLNNANFFTPVDGQLPRMQMYLWNGAKSLQVQAPPPVAGSYNFEKASFGPVTFNLTGIVALVNDGSATPTLGCSTLVNQNQINGKIALVDRGSCEFSLKCLNAQNAGAIAVIVCNNVTGNPIVMGTGNYGSSVTIPSIMMSKQNCDSIKVYLANNVNLTMIAGNPIDGDYDNGIICHEYGHGISIRLTGGAGVNNCLNNTEQMGEGWSDWYGLMLTMEDNDTESRARGIGTYALNQPVTGNGIRAYKYSTNMTTNPHTYQSIVTAVAPHGVGSVWCAMLWELTWSLIREYGYDPDLYRGTGGNNKALAIVTEALKLQPCSPGFVDGRNAILLADSLLYNGENACLIWKSFAKRGLGFSASQGSSASKTDGVQAFDMPVGCCKFVSNSSNSGNGSLREAISCASPGDTIQFLNFIANDTIKLTTSELVINKNLTIQIPETWNTVIQSMGAYPIFRTSENVQLNHIKMRAGTGSGARAILNTGNITLHEVEIHDPSINSGNGNTILNEGTIDVQGNIIIRND